MGESALPSVPRWPGDAQFLLCLPVEAGLCLVKGFQAATWVGCTSLLHTSSEVVGNAFLSFSSTVYPTSPRYHGLLTALMLGQHSIPALYLRLLHPSSPRQQRSGWLDVLPTVCTGGQWPSCNLEPQPALHTGWLAHGEGEACDCLFSRIPRFHHWTEVCLVPAVWVALPVSSRIYTVLRRIWSRHPPSWGLGWRVINT